ncbi:DUF2156 domain-containing protein [Deferribacter autotrophicus]|uniref:DUF2156 domain-containing protein n=1 Tax=Deferribacter autotrophicus TaxID=500465 RepID=A0A5A8F721_9BACT|nr:phosphatidylglycerol lysyltransferase domain-containing protein [Deferribacter autotrophicus]KAA0259495.1 DUF2156 domain-containing protein [Deferribacter autotrophicus]
MFCEKIGLQHKNILFERFKKVDTMISEYNFANIYLFRDKHDYELCWYNGKNNSEYLFIKGITYDGLRYVMPTMNLEEVPKDILRDVLSYVDAIFPVDEKWLDYLKDQFVFDYKDGDSDYIYTVEKISTYKGRKLHKKRNLLKQFYKLYEHECKPLTDDFVNDAREILDLWIEENNFKKDDTDYYACQEALNLLDELVLCGLIYYVNGKPAGFIIGEEHNEDMFVIHFAKGLKRYKGIYQFIYNDFAKRLPKRYKFLNFEQDLGQMALRKAKSSYYPDILLKKFRISLK